MAHQDADGALTKASSAEEVEALIATLDHRGLRESALLESLTAKGLVDSLRRGERLVERKSSAPVERVQPTRRGKPAAGAREPIKEEKDEGSVDVEAQAAEAAGACLRRLASVLRKRKIACPEGWANWKALEKALGEDGVCAW